MAWNRPSAESAAQRQVKKSKVGAWYAVLGASCFVLVAVLVWLMMSSGDDAAKQSREKGGKIIKAAKAAKAAKSSLPTSDAEGQAKKNAEQKMDVFAGPEPTPIKKATKPFVPPKTHQTRVFSTGTEQVIGWVFGCEPGDMPMILPPIDPKERENIVAILISKNEITEKDNEATAELKQRVDLAKKEMMKYLKEGGDPDEFLQYYHKELKRAYEWRSEAIRQCGELFADDEDEDIARAFLKKVNEKFAEEGIKPLDIRQFRPDEPDTAN